MLDPIADKLLVASCLLMLAAENTIHGWALLAAVVILCREILVSGLREYLAELRVSVPVTRLAKWKTTLQLVAVGFLICGEAGDAIVPVVTQIGITLLWLSALLTLYTGWDYLQAGVHHLTRGGCVKVRYFAWVRERVGKAEEEIDPPAGVATVGDLVAWLAQRGEGYAYAFENPKVIRAAIDRNPRARRCADRRRPRDRLLSADDRRLSTASSMTTTIRLQREAFDAAAEAALLTRGRTDIGAVVTFTGICRADENGEPIAALTLEHYPDMAEAEIAPPRRGGARALAAPRRRP